LEQETQVVYVDAAGLPEPQRNGISGLGSKNPLTPTSIGLLDSTQNNQRILLLVALVMQKPSELPWNLLVEV
jgi:hypothetical protein